MGESIRNPNSGTPASPFYARHNDFAILRLDRNSHPSVHFFLVSRSASMLGTAVRCCSCPSVLICHCCFMGECRSVGRVSLIMRFRCKVRGFIRRSYFLNNFPDFVCRHLSCLLRTWRHTIAGLLGHLIILQLVARRNVKCA